MRLRPASCNSEERQASPPRHAWGGGMPPCCCPCGGMPGPPGGPPWGPPGPPLWGGMPPGRPPWGGMPCGGPPCGGMPCGGGPMPGRGGPIQPAAQGGQAKMASSGGVSQAERTAASWALRLWAQSGRRTGHRILPSPAFHPNLPSSPGGPPMNGRGGPMKGGGIMPGRGGPIIGGGMKPGGGICRPDGAAACSLLLLLRRQTGDGCWVPALEWHPPGCRLRHACGSSRLPVLNPPFPPCTHPRRAAHPMALLLHRLLQLQYNSIPGRVSTQGVTIWIHRPKQPAAASSLPAPPQPHAAADDSASLPPVSPCAAAQRPGSLPPSSTRLQVIRLDVTLVLVAAVVLLANRR
jgi:hypothetical protein